MLPYHRKLLAGVGGGVGFDLNNLSYDSLTLDTDGGLDIYVSPDGTKLYTVDDDVYEYTLSTPLDLSTASYEGSYTLTGQEAYPEAIHFSWDGTKMYTCGQGNDTIYQYTLSTAWDVSSASYSDSKNVSAQIGRPVTVCFSPDGTKMYTADGSGTSVVYEYTLSSAWNVNTASYSGNSLNIDSQVDGVRGLAIANDGSRIYATGYLEDSISEYLLSTPFDVSTGTHSVSKSVHSQSTSPQGLILSPDGKKLFMVGSETIVHRYSL
jgi:hypothetical protein